MVEKKLLTLAAVLGILACGACYFGPSPERQPPPPPLSSVLDGIRNIRVEVANASPSHHLDSAALARKIAEAINEQSWKTKVNAHVGKEAEGEDAVLAITVLSETVESRPVGKTERMTFHITASATLTRLDGALVWRETEAKSWFQRNVAEENAAEAWKQPGLEDGVDKELSDTLVFRMFYGNHLN